MSRFFAALGDPARRSRLIIWSLIGLMIAVVLWAFGLVGTSFKWFCEEPCHIVHADNTLAYDAGTHSHVSCISCHEPLQASPITYTLMKIFVMPDLYSTATKTFVLPMNANDETALKMPSAQCTQCHNLTNRPVTPDPGIVISHDAHTKRGISCTTCHNRVAHPEADITLVLKGDQKHDDWMKMTACFRCHGQQPGAKAPGTCLTCHTKEFKLVPASHEATGWYQAFGPSAGHAKAALEMTASIAAAERRGEGSEPIEIKEEKTWPLRASATVNACYTCHKTTFCSDCHGGLTMPHPAEFKKGHGKAGLANPALCAKCHARTPAETTNFGFCNACHHPTNTPGTAWITQHPQTVEASGAQACYKCHNEMQCSYCHVSGVAAGRANLNADFSK